MFDFHKDKPRYFQYQYLATRDYIIPFIEKYTSLKPDDKILEIGSAEAGVLKAFTERGNDCTGIELQSSRVELAKKFMENELKKNKVRFINKDIYDIDTNKDIPHKFDLIILKDVIEHIPHQAVFIEKLREFLSENGKVFFAFPPWQMPFGGHQQMCTNRFLSVLPYYHMLPMPIYKGILKLFRQSPAKIKGLSEIKQTGISIERFEKIIKASGYKILGRNHYLFNPIYKYKYKLKPRKQAQPITALPWLRNFFTTGVYYLVEKTSL